MEQNVINCEGDQKKLFSLIHSLFGSKKITVLPEYTSSFTLASSINMFLLRKFIISKCDCEDISFIKIGRVDGKFEWFIGSIYMNCEGIRRGK